MVSLAVLLAASVYLNSDVYARELVGAYVDERRLAAAEGDDDNWMTHGRTYAEQRFSPLAEVNLKTVSGLSLAWSADFDTKRGQEATPIVVDGVMYVSTAWSKVYALDAKTGAELWRYDPRVPGEKGVYACCDVVNRGVAVWKGSVFVATLDGRLIALNAVTGKAVWSVQTTDAAAPYTITGAPRVFRDKVVIGNGGAEYGVRGYVTAYDTRSGRKVWRFYTVPGNPAKGADGEASDTALRDIARPTWFGDWWKYGGGGTAWDAIVFDSELNQLYIGVGNGSPWNYKVRSAGRGDNLFLSSIVALNPDTGAYLWHYQGTPGESYDFTQTQPIILATLSMDHQPRKVLMQAPKNGFFYVIDRTNGKLVSAKNFVPETWAKYIDLQTGRPEFTEDAKFLVGSKLIVPSALGGHNWMPMSYSPDTGLVYIPTMRTGLVYGQDVAFTFRPGRWNTAVALALPKPDASSPAGAAASLIAWDPLQQREIWHVDQPDMWNGGTLATRGNLVFQGTAAGRFKAYDASTGQQVWEFDAQSGILAGPISYRVAGQQYIAVLAGAGGSAALFAPQPGGAHAPINGRVLAFKLGGDATLAAYEPASLPEPVIVDEAFSPLQVEQGAKLYRANCSMCHGGSVLPDLRRSGALKAAAVWHSIVIGGALRSQGMASFSQYLSDTDAETIRAYLAVQAGSLKK